MIAVIDLTAELAKLNMLDGRCPTTTDAEKSGAIARLAPYRDGAVFASKFAGTSDWERHPRGDEIVHVVDGATTLHLIVAEARQSVALAAGMVAIVPKDVWHKFEAPDGVCVVTATPQPTVHAAAEVDDPRTLELRETGGPPVRGNTVLR